MATVEPLQTTTVERNPDLLRVELTIAQLLRAGVILSFVILTIGIAGVVVTGQTGYEQVRFEDVNSLVGYRAGHPPFPNAASDIITGLAAFKPYAIIALGLVVLIAIPVLRVAVSVIAFAWERDYLYVFITAFVLAMLILSFVIGEVGG